MSRKRCNRRPYKPLIRLNPMELLVANEVYPPQDADRILIRLHSAYSDLRAGTRDDEMFDRVGGAMNVGLIRAEEIGGRQGEGAKVFVRAIGAMAECDRLKATHGKYGFTGPALGLMAEALALYEEILRASTPRQMADAVTECWRRVRQGHVEVPSHVEQ